MSDCSKHKKDVAGISDMKVLAEMIGDLHYESLSKFLCELQTKLHGDSINDISNGNYNLASELNKASHFIYEASSNIESAWQISKPFMEDQNKPT